MYEISDQVRNGKLLDVQINFLLYISSIDNFIDSTNAINWPRKRFDIIGYDEGYFIDRGFFCIFVNGRFKR